MLKNRENLLLTEEECNLINEINCDNESGRHLLGKRSDDYWNMRVTIEEARQHELDGSASDKELQMLEYMEQSSNYEYWNSLPDGQKLFIEVEDEENMY